MYYEFYCPVKVLSGDESIFNLPAELERLGANKPVVITDKGISSSGLLRYVEKAFEDVGMVMPPVFEDVPEESSISAVESAASFFENEGADSLIAIGGGSVLDTAKAVNLMLSGGVKLSELSGVDVVKRKGKPFVAIPTTAGTGSEVTSVAVIFDEARGVKLSFSSEFIMPDVAVLDPKMTLTMPPRLTASTGLDAFSHALEGYMSIQSNPVSRALSYKALEIIWRTLPEVIKHPDDASLRLDMMNASLMAGMSFSNAMVGIIHSMAHALGSVLHIPHGLAVSMFIVPGLKENIDVARKELSELLGITGYSGEGDRALKFVKLVEGFLREIRLLSGIPSSLSEIGVEERHIDLLVDKALLDGSSIFSFVDLTPERARRMVREAM